MCMQDSSVAYAALLSCMHILAVHVAFITVQINEWMKWMK